LTYRKPSGQPQIAQHFRWEGIYNKAILE
jgi:hypothetical protein